MGQRQFAQYGSATSPVAVSDTAASANTLVERDASGDSYVKTLRAAEGVRNAGCNYRAVVNKTTTFTADDTMDVITVDSTAGSVTVNLPAAAGCTGKMLTIKKTVAANSVIIDPNSTETIDGASTLTITTQYAVKRIISDGTVWHVLGS